MFKRICAVCLIFAAAIILFAGPVFSQDNDYDSLVQKFISSSRTSWDNLIVENEKNLTENFFVKTFNLAEQQIGKNNNTAVLYAELIDYIDYFKSGKQQYRGIAFYMLGEDFISIKDQENAFKCVQRMLNMDPQCLRAYLLRGKIEVNLNDIKNAEEDFNKAIKIDPKSEDAHYYLGTLYVIKNDIKNAQKEFEEVLKINPNKAEAKDAIAIITGQAVIKSSKNKEAMDHFNKAEDFFAAQKYKEAIEEYKLAIKADPKFAKAYTYMGDAYDALDDKKEAVVNYKKAIELDPNDRQAHRFLGNTLESLFNKTGDINYLNEAIACYENALKVDPKYFSAQKDLDRAKNKKAGVKQ